MAKKRIKTFNLDDELQSKLLKANFKTVEDVLSQPFLQLMTVLRLSASGTKELVNKLSYGCLPECQTAYEMLEREKNDAVLFGDPKLDQILHGGIKKGILMEIAGPPGVGKTQMCLHLALQCLIMNGSNNAVCYIDTEGSVRTERFIELLQEMDEAKGRDEELMSKMYILQPTTLNSFTEMFIELLQEMDEAKGRDEELMSKMYILQPTTLNSFTEMFIELLQEMDEAKGRDEELMSKMYILQPTTLNSFTEILESLEFFCIEKEIGFVIIDSVASLARKEFSNESNIQRSALLASWAAKIKALAHQLHIAVVVTNQVTSRINSDRSSSGEDNMEDPINYQAEKDSNISANHQVGPALGNTWTHFVNTRLILQFLDCTVRQLIIAKSPVAPYAIKNFSISQAGIKFNEDISCTYNGIDPNQHRIKVEPGLYVS